MMINWNLKLSTNSCLANFNITILNDFCLSLGLLFCLFCLDEKQLLWDLVSLVLAQVDDQLPLVLKDHQHKLHRILAQNHRHCPAILFGHEVLGCRVHGFYSGGRRLRSGTDSVLVITAATSWRNGTNGADMIVADRLGQGSPSNRCRRGGTVEYQTNPLVTPITSASKRSPRKDTCHDWWPMKNWELSCSKFTV